MPMICSCCGILLFIFLSFLGVVNSFNNPSKLDILKPFQNKRALKIISGIRNYDSEKVSQVAWASEYGGATHIDIACRSELVSLVRKIAPSVFVCVSSVDIQEIENILPSKPDMVELGNFDSFFDEGKVFSGDDVLKLAEESKKILPQEIPLCVTIPHQLTITQQIELAQKLKLVGADVLQTEGKVSVKSCGYHVLDQIQLAAPTLSHAYSLSRAVDLPILCSSGLSDITSPLAMACGAAGIGVGTMVNRLENKLQMLSAVKSLAESLNLSVRSDNSISISSSHFGLKSDSYICHEKSEGSQISVLADVNNACSQHRADF